MPASSTPSTPPPITTAFFRAGRFRAPAGVRLSLGGRFIDGLLKLLGFLPTCEDSKCRESWLPGISRCAADIPVAISSFS